MTDQELSRIIEGCRAGERMCQQKIYKHFFNYGLSVCGRYAATQEEAKEVLNDAFFKIFTKLDKYDSAYSFKGWLHRIVVNTAIDRYRSRQKQYITEEISQAQSVEIETEVIENLTREEIFKMVQNLSPAYKTVFNLLKTGDFVRSFNGSVIIENRKVFGIYPNIVRIAVMDVDSTKCFTAIHRLKRIDIQHNKAVFIIR